MAAAAAPPHLAGHHNNHPLRSRNCSASPSSAMAATTIFLHSRPPRVLRSRTCSDHHRNSVPGVLRSHRTTVMFLQPFTSSGHHESETATPPSRLRLLRTSISRRNPTTTIPQHHHRSRASHRSSVTTAPATNLHCGAASPEKKKKPAAIAVTREGGECESETLILESVLCAMCQRLIGQSNWAKLLGLIPL
ncbi:hypothetical protein DEO72_LG10g1607 [Vigna unguiculata]|uniref:Uncharacterized protein n=1 Tax=Vigna unguiculata TaxID=3917 RepID=A0A4D6NEP9_VIGUN|nr:hypothetical protein DEO72_LG10g1607 [Vigna unguiculata]